MRSAHPAIDCKELCAQVSLQVNATCTTSDTTKKCSAFTALLPAQKAIVISFK